MLHELIFCLHGFPGDICTQIPASDSSEAPEVRLKLLSERFPFVAPSEIGLITQMHSIGENYLRIQRFIEEFCLPFSGSLYLTALAYGLDEALQEYRSTLASVEADLLGSPYLGITYIFSKVEPFRPILSSLVHFLDLCKAHYQKNSSILNCLLMVNKSPAITLVSRHLLQLFHRQVLDWLLYGTFHDPYEEFFITSNHHLVPEKFPTIISPTFANDILYSGKAVHSSGSDLSDRLVEVFAQKFDQLESAELVGDVDIALERLIHNIWCYVSKEVWLRMFEKFGLVDYLNFTRDVLLLGRGELFVTFLDNLLVGGTDDSGPTKQYILDRAVPDSVAEAKSLAYALDGAFLAAARSVGMDDEQLASRFK